jgi:hypothetical protein
MIRLAIPLFATLIAFADTAQAQLFGRPDWRDGFGNTLATGDFDGDGFVDLAIGVEQEINVGVNFVYGGQVHVVYGSEDGLDPWRQQLWNLTTMNVHPFDQGQLLSRGLETGDFNNDGFDDLAIGAHNFAETPNGFAGVVYILHGSANGLTNQDLQTWYENRADLDGEPSGVDYFGYDLTAGDYNGDDFDDLAIGIPAKTVDGILEQGQILVLSGSAEGLTAAGHRYIDQPSDIDADDPGPNWGLVMESGDINGDGFDELAVGLETKDIEGHENAGAVAVLFGGPNGLTLLGYDFLYQGEAGIPDAPEPQDGFGASLVLADFGTDGFDDLIIGAPFENKTHDSISDDGAMFGFFGSEGGLSPERRYMWWSTAFRSRDSREPTTISRVHWPPVTSTATATTTWQSASPVTTRPKVRCTSSLQTQAAYLSWETRFGRWPPTGSAVRPVLAPDSETLWPPAISTVMDAPTWPSAPWMIR